MDRLPNERAQWVVATVAALRGRGGYGEDEIAEKVGFGSAEALRAQLAGWGMPAWFLGSAGAPRGRSPPNARREGLSIGRLRPAQRFLRFFPNG